MVNFLILRIAVLLYGCTSPELCSSGSVGATMNKLLLSVTTFLTLTLFTNNATAQYLGLLELESNTLSLSIQKPYDGEIGYKTVSQRSKFDPSLLVPLPNLKSVAVSVYLELALGFGVGHYYTGNTKWSHAGLVSTFGLWYSSLVIITSNAVKKKYHLETKVLLRMGADTELSGDDGDTPLIETAKKDYLRLARLLLKYKANINSRDKLGRTPIYWAIWFKKISVMRLLLHSGADINMGGTFREKTPLHAAVPHSVPTILNILLKYSPFIDPVDTRFK
jgi:ankyrin repeat protein